MAKRIRPMEQMVYCGNRPTCERTTALQVGKYLCGSPNETVSKERIHYRADPLLGGYTIQCTVCDHYTVFYHPSDEEWVRDRQ